MDEINLNIDNLETTTLNISDDDFGSSNNNFGMEMLMNTKKISGGGGGGGGSGSKGQSIDLGDLDSLETELNNLSFSNSFDL